MQLENRQSGTVPLAPIGLAVDELDPFVVDLRDGPHFIITGPPRGGKSTLLRTWLQSLAFSMAQDRLRLYLADFDADFDSAESAAACTSSGQWCAVRSNDDLARVLDDLTGAYDPDIVRVLAIDDLDGLLRACDAPTLIRLEAVVRSRRPGIFVLLAGTSSRLASAYDGVGQAVKEGQTGFLLGGSDYEDQQVLGLSISHSEVTRGQSPGQGYFARRKRLTRVKIAEPLTDR